MKIRIVAAAVLGALLVGQNALAQTATVTATPSATPSVTSTPTPTPAKPIVRERGKERDTSVAAKPEFAAPRIVPIVSDQGNAVDNRVARLVLANSYRIRGLAYSAEVLGSECTITLKVGGTTIVAPSLLGLAGQANYIPFTPPIEVPAGTEVTVLTEVTGTNSGLAVSLDTIP